ncbi:hypothetical protein Patl1_11480 [Pistacia atlantica]|uniref:Uncharacterized protein n=1 Tax=Pistacia atlantica TaxID=434234 RepID=A0ACC1A2S1_9ROSI|nr:hypothetical protein Patl1_11480 [Pistacia atlantica]
MIPNFPEVSPCLAYWRNSLRMPKEIIRINFSFHCHQSLKIIFEIHGTPSIGLCKTWVTFLVHPQIKIPVINISRPGV